MADWTSEGLIEGGEGLEEGIWVGGGGGGGGGSGGGGEGRPHVGVVDGCHHGLVRRRREGAGLGVGGVAGGPRGGAAGAGQLRGHFWLCCNAIGRQRAEACRFSGLPLPVAPVFGCLSGHEERFPRSKAATALLEGIARPTGGRDATTRPRAGVGGLWQDRLLC